jgi:hypothetical protein
MKSLHTLLSREILAKSPLILKLQDAFNRFDPQVNMDQMGYYCGKLVRNGRSCKIPCSRTDWDASVDHCTGSIFVVRETPVCINYAAAGNDKQVFGRPGESGLE